MYSATIFLSALGLLTSTAATPTPAAVTNATLSTRDGPGDVFVHDAVVAPKSTLTNAQRFARGLAPAAPLAFRREGTPINRLRHDLKPRASSTPSQPPPVCVITANAVPLWDSSSNHDDEYRQLDLPTGFSVQIYDQSSSTIFLSTNGVYSIGSGSPAFIWPTGHETLPQSNIPAYSILPFYGDEYIVAGTAERIYYSIVNNNRIIYFLSDYHNRNDYFHFTVDYSMATPGVFHVKYYTISDSGAVEIVGAQGMRNGGEDPYHSASPIITSGLALTIDTNANTITPGTFNAGAAICA
ncbi:hypothetical protein FB451DRAFT_1043884 [Mycena latifolia]|nr:hypothetical protein FB451DRAFT_1043884 [Mycena latifolia]